ncbi:hypothetical protein BPORC_1818 [Bifidobacterium porcinum]|nr:hypothetical protein BPORC_1818 [Bifidobacterium porcinum]
MGGALGISRPREQTGQCRNPAIGRSGSVAWAPGRHSGLAVHAFHPSIRDVWNPSIVHAHRPCPRPRCPADSIGKPDTSH